MIKYSNSTRNSKTLIASTTAFLNALTLKNRARQFQANCGCNWDWLLLLFARDFSYFGELGKTGIWLWRKNWWTLFCRSLNDNAITNVAIVGIGNMGSALLNYRFHERNKMKIVMVFGSRTIMNRSPKVRTEFIFTVFPLLKKSSNKKASKQQSWPVPSVKAQEVASLLVDAGVKGILSSHQCIWQSLKMSSSNMSISPVNCRHPLFHAKTKNKDLYFQQEKRLGQKS